MVYPNPASQVSNKPHDFQADLVHKIHVSAAFSPANG